jgi:hypothetical protein
MTNLTWYKAVDDIKAHVVRISTPRGTGTGFLLSHDQQKHFCAIATAAHVVDHAHYWEDPIRVEHIESDSSALIRVGERAIFLHDDDTAAIVLVKDKLPLPDAPLPMIEEGQYLRVGNDIAWLGFPAIQGASLCFFGGRVSAWISHDGAYLVDGVAINGVSGGPAFYIKQGKEVNIMGVVSAYAPNRATGEVLPGLSVVRSVRKLHEVIKSLSSFDEAKEQETPPSAPGSPSEGSPDAQKTGKGL